MIVQAMRDLRITEAKRLKDRRSAQAWLLSNDEQWPYAFVPICATLGLEPTAVRRALGVR